MSLINGFDYRSQQPVRRTKTEWRKEIRAAVQAGGQRKVVEGDTMVTLPVKENIGAPFFERTTQVLAFEVHDNIPL
jgi:hypothetical protein